MPRSLETKTRAATLLLAISLPASAIQILEVWTERCWWARSRKRN